MVPAAFMLLGRIDDLQDNRFEAFKVVIIATASLLGQRFDLLSCFLCPCCQKPLQTFDLFLLSIQLLLLLLLLLEICQHWHVLEVWPTRLKQELSCA